MAWVDVTSAGRSHSFGLASALAELGLLNSLHTGVVIPGAGVGKHWKKLAGLLPTSDRARLQQRDEAGLPLDLVNSIPTVELLEQVGRRFVPTIDGRTWTYVASEIFDRRVAQRIASSPARVAHAFEHSALRSLERARTRGMVTVLEQPIIHIDSYLRREDAAVQHAQVPSPFRPPGFWSHVRRKQREYAVADYCFVGLPSAADTMAEGGFARDRIFITPYGAPPPSWTESRRTESDARSRLRVLFVGHLDFYKGLHILLDAWADLPQDQFELTIVGIADPSWRTYFLDRIQRFENVEYRGTVPSREMSHVYAEHDVLAFPSQVGGVGLSTFEALRAGVVPIVPLSEGILVDGVDCFVVKEQSASAWAKSLTVLANDRALVERLAIGGRAAANDLSTASYVAAVRHAYRTIAERENIVEMAKHLDGLYTTSTG